MLRSRFERIHTQVAAALGILLFIGAATMPLSTPAFGSPPQAGSPFSLQLDLTKPPPLVDQILTNSFSTQIADSRVGAGISKVPNFAQSTAEGFDSRGRLLQFELADQQLLPEGQIVPVSEPATWFTAALVVGFLAWKATRSFRQKAIRQSNNSAFSTELDGPSFRERQAA